MQSRDPRVESALISLLSDDWVIVREAAASGLGNLRVAAAIPRLIEMIENDPIPDVRRVAAVALGNLGDPIAIPGILELGGQQPRFQMVMVDAVVRMGRMAVPHLIRLLQNGSPEVRAGAIVALGRLEDSSATRALLKLLPAADTATKLQILDSLARIGDPTARNAVVGVLRESTIETAVGALAALARLADPQCVAAITPFLTHPSEECRGLAASALGQASSEQSVAGLARLLTDTSPEVRRRAVAALGEIGVAKTVPFLVNATCDLDSEVRQQAAVALGKLADPRGVAPLIVGLRDRVSTVRKACAEGLGHLGAASAVSGLSHLLESESVAEVRLAGIRALGQIGDGSALPALRQTLNLDEGTRCRACVAIAELGTPEAVDQLLELRRDSAAEVRYHAAIGLGNIADSRCLTGLEEMLNDDDPFVLRGVVRALGQFGPGHARDLIARARVLLDEQTAPRRAASPVDRTKAGRGVVGMLPAAILGLSGNRRVLLGAALFLGVLLGAWLLWPQGRPTPYGIPQTGQTDPSLQARGPVVAAGFASGSQFACVTGSGKLELWDAVEGTRIKQVGSVPIGANWLAVSPRGDLAAVSSENSQIHLLNLQTGSEVGVLNGHRSIIRLLQFSPDGRRLCSAGLDRTFIIWDLEKRGALWQHRIEGTEVFETFAVDRELETVAYGSRGGRIEVVGVNSQRKARSIPAFATPVTALRFGSDSRTLAVADGKGNVAVWDLVRRQPTFEFSLSGGVTSHLVFGQDGRMLYAARPGGIAVLDLDRQESRFLPDFRAAGDNGDGADQYDCVTVDGEGRWAIACGQLNREMCCWKLPQGESARPLLPTQK